jgi:hypothetical protein
MPQRRRLRILVEAKALSWNGKSVDDPDVGKWEMQLLCPSCDLKMLTSKTRAALSDTGREDYELRLVLLLTTV